MRFRSYSENGKHLVKTRDDTGEWLESRSYASQEEAEAVAAKGEAMNADTIAEVEKVLTGPKGTAHHGVAPKPRAEVKSPEKLPTKTEGATRNVPDLDKDAKSDKEDWSDLDPHDFTVIPGIGAATAERLHAGGLKTLRMLSRVSASKAEELGIREEWIARAKELSDG